MDDLAKVMPLFGGVFLIGMLAFVAIIIAAWWQMFTKAGQPGWAAIVPIYNMIVLLKIVGKPLWWVLLFLIPLINLVIAIIVYVELAKRFGKGAGFAVGLLFLGFIFSPFWDSGALGIRVPRPDRCQRL